MSVPNFETQQDWDAYFDRWSAAADFDRYFATVDDHSPFLDWMLRRGTVGKDFMAMLRQAQRPPMQVMTVRMPSGLVERLDARAGQSRQDRSALVREAVARYLDELDGAA